MSGLDLDRTVSLQLPDKNTAKREQTNCDWSKKVVDFAHVDGRHEKSSTGETFGGENAQA